MDIIKKHALSMVVFEVFFLVAMLVTVNLGIRSEIDTGTYYYFTQTNFFSQIPNLLRPLGYALFIFFTTNFTPHLGFQITVIAQAVLYALSAVFIYVVASRVIENKAWIFVCLYFLLFNYNPVSFVSVINSEILVLFMFTTISIYVGVAAKRLRDIDIIMIVLAIAALIFTKPMYIFYPVVVLVYMLFLAMCRAIAKMHLALSAVLMLLLIVLPVWGWTFGNKVKYGYASFSAGLEVDVAGKLFQYDMIEKGPDMVEGVDIKSRLLRYPNKAMDINKKIDILNLEPDLQEELRFEPLLFDFTRTTLLNNLSEYAYKSLRMITPNVIEIFSLDVGECTLKGLSERSEEMQLICSHPFLYYFVLLYSFFYETVLRGAVIILAIPSLWYFIREVIKISMGKPSKNGAVYISLYMSVAYIVINMVFGTYNQFRRQLIPAHLIGILLLCMTAEYFTLSVTNCITLGKEYLLKRSMIQSEKGKIT